VAPDAEPSPPTPFLRGDASGDGEIDMLDITAIDEYLSSTAALPCLDAADADDDGHVVGDDIDFMVEWLSSDPYTPPIPPPHPGWGLDPTGDELDCAAYPAP
jgi:hypothetical protein